MRLAPPAPARGALLRSAAKSAPGSTAPGCYPPGGDKPAASRTRTTGRRPDRFRLARATLIVYRLHRAAILQRSGAECTGPAVFTVLLCTLMRQAAILLLGFAV